MTATSVPRTPADSLATADFTVYDYTHQAWVKEQRYVPCGHLGPCGCYGKAHAGEPADVHSLANCDRMEHGVHVAADCPGLLR